MGMPGMMPGMQGMGMPQMMPGMQGMGMPQMMPQMMPQGMPMGPMGGMGGYPCYPMGPVAPGSGFGPMGGDQQQVAGVGTSSGGDCGCGAPQGYRSDVPYGYAPYGYPMAPSGYYNPQGYGYGNTNEERNEGSDFEGPEYDDES
jgi:morphogenetic protein associated with SpoVID